MDEQRRRILVIDDSAPYLNFMRVLLSEDFDVATATTLQEAQQSLAISRPDLIITDALFPGLQPLAVLDSLRWQPETSDIPILLCTGAVQEVQAAADRLQRAGVKVVIKPFDIDDLFACIKELIGEP